MLKVLKRLPSLGATTKPKPHGWSCSGLHGIPCMGTLDRRRYLSVPIKNLSQIIMIRRASFKAFPQQVVNFLKQESEYLAETLSENDENYDNTLTMNFSNLDPEIKRTLDESMDVYNKLIRLLSFNPADIPSGLYMNFIDTTGLIIDDNIKPLLIKRLVFQREFDYIWKNFVSETSTINDIEEIVDLIGKTLKENNHLKVGLLEASISANNILNNQALKGIVFDSFAFNFHTHKLKLIEAVDDPDQIYFTDSNDDYDDDFKWLLGARKVLLSKGMNKSTTTTTTDQLDQLDNIFNNPSSCSCLPGWFAFISQYGHINPSQIPEIHLILDKFSCITMNDYDFNSIISLNSLSNDTIYKLFEKSYKPIEPDIKTSWSLDLIITNALANNQYDLVNEIICKNHYLISTKMLIISLQELYNYDESQCIGPLQQMISSTTTHRNYLKVYETILETLKFTQHHHHHHHHNNHHHHHQKCPIIFHKVMLATKDSPQFYKNLRTYLPITNDNKHEIIDLYKQFIWHEIPPTKVLLELIRLLMVKNRILHEDLILPIIGGLLAKLTEINSDGTRIIKGKYINKFHNSIRAICQSISNLNQDEIILMLNNISNYITNDPPNLNHSSVPFNDYLIKNFIYETFNFLDRKLLIDQLIYIAEGLNSEDIKRALLYLYQVKNNPKHSLEILDTFKHNKSQLNRKLMEAIENGILTCLNLQPSEKLQIFRDFRNQLILNGYKSKLLKKNAIILIELMLQSSNSNLQSFDRILSFAKKQKIPQHIINKWSRSINHL